MRVSVAALLLASLVLAACGSVAEPRPTFEPTSTAPGQTVALAQEQTAPPSQAPVSATPQPSATPTAAATATPTEEVTQEPTEETAAEGAVVVNGVVGDPAIGDFWFNDPGGAKTTYNGTEWQCHTCHTPNEPKPGSGPFMYGIAAVAGERVAGQDAITYLYTSITDPAAFTAPDQTAPDGTVYKWEADKMPNNWKTVLDDQQIADIVAYLMTLDQERPE